MPLAANRVLLVTHCVNGRIRSGCSDTGAVPSALPDGDRPPLDGALPASALQGVGERPFGIYVHVPFCATRCGYCDFNTYTGLQHLQPAFVDAAVHELRLARRILGDGVPPIDTVFLGGGTPTLLPPDQLARLLRAVHDVFGLRPDAEVTTEANPDSVDRASLGALRAAGYNRISFGMQSAVPGVLRVLERTHRPGRPQEAAREALDAGFDQVSLDLIYGTPGETADDWCRSLDAVLDAAPTHVSAYALVVETGTALARQVARGLLPPPDDDVLADRYLAAERALANLGWYEVSNWGQPCRHNLAYWRGGDWWGIGPGAHSHVGGVRWWNVKHPYSYVERLAGGQSPAAGREILTAEARRVERILLELRLRDGLPLSVLRPAGAAAAARLVVDGLLDASGHRAGRAVLTLRGRLLADAVVRDLVD